MLSTENYYIIFINDLRNSGRKCILKLVGLTGQRLKPRQEILKLILCIFINVLTLVNSSIVNKTFCVK